MIDIIVIRAPGDVDGGEVSSPLLCDVNAAIARGTQEIEAHAKARKVTERTLFRAGVRKGQVVEVLDSLQGPAYRAVVMGLSHVCEGPTVYTVLDLERPIP